MSDTYQFEKIEINRASSDEIGVEIVKRKMQLHANKNTFNVDDLQRYIDELKTRKKELKILTKSDKKEGNNPSYKALLIVSFLFLIVFGFVSIYAKSFILGMVAFIDLLICLIALFNYLDSKRKESIK